MLVLGLSAGTVSAQFGFGGVVYDPTNYHNALLRYFQLQQQLIQLGNSYAQLVAQYNLAIRMAKNIQNMPARYRALFSPWRSTGDWQVLLGALSLSYSAPLAFRCCSER